ncbi:MAG: methyl-accepting chemotaxis protein [Desulfosalsimonadaceae bacterium]
MKKLKQMSLGVKVIAITVGLVVAAGALLWFASSHSLERAIYKEKKEKTSELAEVGISVLKYYHGKVKAGDLSREEAQERAKESIRTIRYGPKMKDYFWIQDFTPRVVMHPFSPGLEGEDVSGFADPNGKHLFSAMVKKVEQKGSGHVPYEWKYYGNEDRIEPKLSYVAEFEPWDWIVGTGVYIDSIERDLAAQSKLLFLITLAIVGASICTAFLFSRSINRVLTRIVEGLGQSSEQVSAASDQVAGSSQSLAEGSSEQASSLEETSSSLEEIASQTRQNSDNADQADNAVKETAKVVENGVASMERMNAAINEIKESSNETSKIIKTIDDIAFQTNLLALNAAVEAARAGEAGKGFAVVAEEVRNLAQRSAEAAQNTSQLIEKSQENAGNGVNVAEEVATQLKSIKESSGKVNTLISEIAAASKEQAQGIDQVNTAVSEMDKVVQQNAADSEESASAAEELSAQASEMEKMVAELKAMVEGQNRAPARAGSGEAEKRRSGGKRYAKNSRSKGEHGQLPSIPDAGEGKE